MAFEQEPLERDYRKLDITDLVKQGLPLGIATQMAAASALPTQLVSGPMLWNLGNAPIESGDPGLRRFKYGYSNDRFSGMDLALRYPGYELLTDAQLAVVGGRQARAGPVSLPGNGFVALLDITIQDGTPCLSLVEKFGMFDDWESTISLYGGLTGTAPQLRPSTPLLDQATNTSIDLRYDMGRNGIVDVSLLLWGPYLGNHLKRRFAADRLSKAVSSDRRD